MWPLALKDHFFFVFFKCVCMFVAVPSSVEVLDFNPTTLHLLKHIGLCDGRLSMLSTHCWRTCHNLNLPVKPKHFTPYPCSMLTRFFVFFCIFKTSSHPHLLLSSLIETTHHNNNATKRKAKNHNYISLQSRKIFFLSSQLMLLMTIRFGIM